MFDTCITLFNYAVSEDTYYSKVINNAEFQPIYKTEPELTGTDNRTSCLVIVPYSFDKDNSIYINTDKDKSYYSKPKEWEKLTDKTGYFTLQNDIDFIAKGNRSDLSDVTLNEMKNSYDDVFVINQIKDFSEFIISHFELTVN